MCEPPLRTVLRDGFWSSRVKPAAAPQSGGVLALIVVFAAAAGVVWVGDSVAVAEAAALTVLTLAALWVLARVVTRRPAGIGRPVGTAPGGVHVPLPVTGDEVRVTATVEDLLGDGDVWPSQRLARLAPASDLTSLPQATTAALEANRVWLREEWTR